MTLLEVYRMVINLQFDLHIELSKLAPTLSGSPNKKAYDNLLQNAAAMNDNELALGIDDELKECGTLYLRIQAAKDTSVSKLMRQMESIVGLSLIVPDDSGMYAKFKADSTKFISETTHNIVTGNTKLHP